MERKKFFQIIDNLAADWYIDTAEPVTSKVRRSDGTVVSGARPPERAKDWEGPNWTGPAQIVEWQPRKSYCIQCQRVVDNHLETIDLRKGKTKCHNCDQRITRYSDLSSEEK